MQHATKTVAVITSSIGRPELEQTILSVQQQSYSCQHYVFVDGKQHWQYVKHLEASYPNVIFTFLPMNTGGKNHIGNGAIHAIAPYLVQEDMLCFLDDDNWYEPQHIENLVKFIDQHQLDYAYALRKVMNKQGEFLYNDNAESLGFWFTAVSENITLNGDLFNINNENRGHLVDTNTYAIRREIAFKLSEDWYSGLANDRNIFRKLLSLNLKGGCNAQRTVNYRANYVIDHLHTEANVVTQEHIQMVFKQHSEKIEQQNPPWLTPTLFIEGKLVPLKS